ncbi:14157_t:CDS:2, partial [Acaulospora colombiana]
NWSPRQGTVAAILELLLEYRLVQVRGTPASGKSTLLALLRAHIVQVDKKANVFVYKNWPQNELESDEYRVETRLPEYPGFDDNKQFLLFDEGQQSYWDTRLWKFFKDEVQRREAPIYAIIFCSYGNENLSDRRILTPVGFDAKVTLERVQIGDSKSYGLLLHEKEFDEVLERQKPKLYVASDLRDFIYKFTRGHVGHTLAVVDFLVKKREGFMLSGHEYDVDSFHQDNPSYDEFNHHLVKHSVIHHGFPYDPEPYILAMKELLLHGEIVFNDHSFNQDTLLKLKEAHENGFVELNEDKRYTFPSPLIRQVWSWHLLPSPNYQLPYTDLFSLVKATVAHFRPSQLTGSDRRIGASDHRPPKAQYQDEYYRCVHEITNGNVRISPEYAAATGTRA